MDLERQLSLQRTTDSVACRANLSFKFKVPDHRREPLGVSAAEPTVTSRVPCESDIRLAALGAVRFGFTLVFSQPRRPLLKFARGPVGRLEAPRWRTRRVQGWAERKAPPRWPMRPAGVAARTLQGGVITAPVKMMAEF